MNARCRWEPAGELLDTIRGPGELPGLAPNASFREGPYLARLTADLLRDIRTSSAWCTVADSRYRIYATVLDAYEAI